MVTTKHHQTKLLRTRSDKIFDAVNMVFILLVLILCAYPIYYTIIASFSCLLYTLTLPTKRIV